MGAPDFVGQQFFRAGTIETQSDDEFKFVASDETPDRYGDIVRMSGWDLKAYKQNPIVLFGHSSSMPVGISRWIGKEDGPNGPRLSAIVRMAAEGTSDFIDTLRRLLKQGIVKAVSVGFRVTKKPNLLEDADGRITGIEFVGQELLELSIVSVPANPNALATAKSMGLAVSNDALTRLRSVTLDERIIQRATADSLSDKFLAQEFLAQKRREMALMQLRKINT